MIKSTSNQNLIRTFFSYSIPCIVAMFLTSFITIVDGIFIGWKMGEKGLAAINLTIPIFYILLAITIMVGVGGVTLASQRLGEKNHSSANHYFTFSLVTNLIVNIAAMVILKVFLPNIIHMLNASGEIATLVKDFLGTISFFYIFMMMNLTFSMFIRSEGKPQLSMFFGIAGNILNIILDYILIMRLDLGMKGAAFASGISVLIPFMLGVLYFISKKSVYKLCRINFNFADLRVMLFNGSAEFVSQISVSITTYISNLVILHRMGLEGVAALTIIGYVSFIQNMILTGIAIGIHPIVSYNFGAKNRELIINLLSIAIKAVLAVGITVFAISFLGADGIVHIFGRRGSGSDIAQNGLRIFSASFILNGYNIISAAYFTSICQAKTAALISGLRSLFLVVLFIIVLPYLIGNTGVWLTVPLTELVTFIVAYKFMKKSRLELLIRD